MKLQTAFDFARLQMKRPYKAMRKQEASVYIDKYLNKFPEVRKWIEELKKGK